MSTNPLWEKFNAIIVDDDIDTRMRLRQATSSVPQFSKVTPLTELREANQRLASEGRCDVIFLSCNFSSGEISQFVQSAKETKGGQDTAYILVLKTSKQDSSTVANSVMMGLDGFLFEPYSVDQLVEITTLAARVRKERTQARERIALTLLIGDMINQLDLVAYLRALEHEPGTSWRKFKDLCATLPNLSPESFDLYVRIAINLFENAPPPKKVFRADQYKGASSRVKKKMGAKIAADAEKEFAKARESKEAELKEQANKSQG